jgi:hypothetical protein
MKLMPVAALCVAALIPGLMQAAPPADAPLRGTIKAAVADAPLRGAIKAAVDVCSRIVPKNEERFERRAKALRGKLSGEHDEDIAREPRFQQAYKLVESALNEAPLADAEQACADFFL